jgi:hypothetical protein
MWNDRYSAAGLGLAGRAAFDPGTLMIASMASTVAGSALSAQATLAGGAAARQAGMMQQQEANYEADQLDTNAVQSIAASQRRALEDRQRARLANSSLIARAAASGVNPSVGSPLATSQDIAMRGEYQALLDLFQGENEATGLRNKAAGVRYSGQAAAIGGEEAAQAARLTAAATLIGGAGSALRGYGTYFRATIPDVSIPSFGSRDLPDVPYHPSLRYG